MIEPRSGDLHPQFVTDCEIARGQSAGMMLLGKEDCFGGAVQASPLGYSPLEGTPCRIGKLAGILLLQPIEERLGFQPWFVFELGLYLMPNVGKGIDSRSIRTSFLSLRWQRIVIAIVSCCLLRHFSHPCCRGERLALIEQSPQFFDLSIRDHRKLRKDRDFAMLKEDP